METHGAPGRHRSLRSVGGRLLAAAVLAAAVAVGTAGTVGVAQPSGECPAGTTAVAKYEWNDGTSSYVAEFGGSVVTVSGTESGGTFTSSVPIGAVTVFGGGDSKTDIYNPPVTSGSFDNSGLVNVGGQTPEISHVTFCQSPAGNGDNGNGGNGNGGNGNGNGGAADEPIVGGETAEAPAEAGRAPAAPPAPAQPMPGAPGLTG